ncbi:MAG: DUF4838 domain-containing protein [Kiritimatiellae bacterium]|nr:DUF4838 domain-containing protein [Kiritimatiellia bacterium]
MKNSVIALAAITTVAVSFAEAHSLVLNGKARCAVVVKADAEPPLKFGAAELTNYLARVTGAAPEVVNAAAAGRYNVFVGMVSDTELLAAAGVTAAELKRFGDPLFDDGYAIVVKASGLYVIGANDRGALYGCYDVLKRWAGVRWLVPGEDGEYFTRKATITVPEGKIVEKPALYTRTTSGYGEPTLLWQARNRMQNRAFRGGLEYNAKRPDLDARADFFRGVACRGSNHGGHIMSALMFGDEWGSTKPERLATATRYFKEHPEWFPLINGKRFVGSYSHEGAPNPCLTNAELLDRMASNLIGKISGKYGAQAYVTLGNNDTTVWCECDRCRAIDAPEALGTKGERSDRYWWVINELAKRVWKVLPDAHLGGWAYQDFWYPPRHVKPDKRLRVMISYNNQCWRHAITDPKCNANAELEKIYEAWKKLEMPIVVNRDEIACEGSPGSDLLPSESVLRDNFRAYEQLGCSGSSFFLHPPFPEYMSWSKNMNPFFGKSWWWYSMWQTCYLSAEFMWNPGADYDALYEEINALYYGKGWEGGLKAFRKLLEKAFFSTPGCIGWGQGAPLGKGLDLPGSEEKLKALLEQALAAAATDPDPRAKAHVQRTKEIFEMTWLIERKKYLESYREAKAYRSKGKITLDGVLDEQDWRDAEPITAFFVPPWETKVTNIIGHTEVRICHEREHLYIAAACYDPEMPKLVAGDTCDRVSGYEKLGERVEIFYSHPDMFDKAYHLIINMNGCILDAFRENVGSFDTSFTTDSKWAVKKYPDRWTLELAVPVKETGMLCYPGATWKFNLGRCRVVPSDKPGERKTQVSTCANGHMYSPGNFVYLKLLGEKGK